MSTIKFYNILGKQASVEFSENMDVEVIRAFFSSQGFIEGELPGSGSSGSSGSSSSSSGSGSSGSSGSSSDNNCMKLCPCCAKGRLSAQCCDNCYSTYTIANPVGVVVGFCQCEDNGEGIKREGELGKEKNEKEKE